MKLNQYTPAVYFFFALTLFFSCKSDPCDDVLCIKGSCFDGNCDCEAGYEGTDCSIKSIQKFIGSWNGTDDCGSGIHKYIIIIAASSTSLQTVTISNFGGLGTNTLLTAIVSGSSISIDIQNTGNNYIINGTGSISKGGNQIEFTYTVIDPMGNISECFAILNFG